MLFKHLGIAASLALLLVAGYLGWRPWRVHGGRFVTEHVVLSGALAVVALLILAASLLLGSQDE